jgi:hypothetical protein
MLLLHAFATSCAERRGYTHITLQSICNALQATVQLVHTPADARARGVPVLLAVAPVAVLAAVAVADAAAAAAAAVTAATAAAAAAV